MALAIITILLNNDPDQLRNRSCFASLNFLWFCDSQVNDPSSSRPTTERMRTPQVLTLNGSADPARDNNHASLAGVRPNVTVTGNIALRYGNTADVLVRITVQNPTDQPMQVAWSRIRSNAQVTLADGTAFKPTRASDRQPVGIDDCRWSAEICWQKYRGAFTEIQPHEVTTGTMTFSADLPSQTLEEALDTKRFDFNARLMFGRSAAAIPEVLSVSVTNQPLL